MSAAIAFGALLLDAAVGEPRAVWSRLPHPAVLLGRVVNWLDHRLNRPPRQRLGGIVAVLVLLAVAAGIGALLSRLPAALEIVAASTLLAQRSLVQHVTAVADALRLSVGDGRVAVARIVGRDTATLDRAGVARAAIESAAENFSDGVVAPVFWLLVGGLPGLVAYKAVNTADSMIGYRTPRHEAFGWAAARLDDAMNWVPARLAAVLLALVGGWRARWADMRRDAGHHRSPNAGWPEAAMAGALGVALAGPRSYQGTLTDDPFVNPKGRRDAGAEDVDRAVSLLWRAWLVLLGAIALAAALG